MEDTTNNRPNRGDSPDASPLAIDAADLLISDDASWDGWPITKSTETCGRVRNVGINTSSGNLWFVPVSCRSYGHRPCAERLVKGFLRTIDANLAEDRSGFVVVMTADAYERDRLKHRLSDLRSAGRAGRSDWYRTVQRSDGTVTVVSTVRLTGRFEPATMEPVDDLLVAAAEALRLPGVVQFTGTRWAVPPDDGKEKTTHSFGRMFEDQREAFLTDVADEVFRRHGVRIDAEYPMGYPRRITMEEYIACGEAVKERIE